jgi:hypothetical protein
METNVEIGLERRKGEAVVGLTQPCLGFLKSSLFHYMRTHTRTNAELQGRAEAEWESQKG